MASAGENAVRASVAVTVVVGLAALALLMRPSTEPVEAPVTRPTLPVSAPKAAPRPKTRPVPRAGPPLPTAPPSPGLSAAELEELVGDTDAPDDELPKPFEDTALPDVDGPSHLQMGDLAMATGYPKRAARHFGALADAEGDTELGFIARYKQAAAELRAGEDGAARRRLRQLVRTGEDGGVPPAILDAAQRDLDGQ